MAIDARRALAAAAPAVAAAAIGGLGSRNAPETYARLSKPRWAPPASVFGPMWTGLYAMIAVAGYRVASHATPRTQALHAVQLAANAAWPATFFGRRDKRLSLGVIAVLDAALMSEIARLRREDPAAAALLVPYLAWSGFATALNAAVSEPA